MSSFGRGRGIVPNKYVVTPPIPSIKNGSDSRSSNQPTSPTVEKVPVTLPVSLLSLSDDIPKNSSLQTFGEKLLSVKDDYSLFLDIVDIIKSPDCTVKTVERMIEIIIDRCMRLPMISRKFSSLLPFLVSHKLYGKDIKRFFLDSLQTLYKDRDSLRYSKKYGENTFRNAVILTGEVYYRFRVGSSRYKFIGEALLNYLNILANSVHDGDLLILTQQLSWTGHDMAETNASLLNQLMLTIRTNLTDHSSAYSNISRSYLLLCLELNFTPFNNLSEVIKEFYCNNIGEKSFSSIKPPSLELDNMSELYNTIIQS